MERIINGIKVTYPDDLTPKQVNLMFESKKMQNLFKKWHPIGQHIDSGFCIGSVDITDVTMFGPDKFGMCTMHVNDIYTSDNRKLHNQTLFVRGDATAILPILVTPDGKEHTIVTQQARLATGNDKFYEIIAGMLDNHTLHAAALSEIKQESGVDFHLKPEDIMPLTSMFPSPGGCDEQVDIVSFKKHISYEELNAMTDKHTGVKSEGEHIVTKVIELKDLKKYAPMDAKALVAYGIYMEYINNIIISLQEKANNDLIEKNRALESANQRLKEENEMLRNNNVQQNDGVNTRTYGNGAPISPEQKQEIIDKTLPRTKNDNVSTPQHKM